MTLTPNERRAIERRDREAREAREAQELIALAAIAYPDWTPEATEASAMVVRSDARAMGATTALTYRASRSSWLSPSGHLRGFVVGVATDTPLDAAAILDRLARDGEATLTVVAPDGSRETRTVASYRKGREATGPREATETVATEVPETARLGITHILTGD